MDDDNEYVVKLDTNDDNTKTATSDQDLNEDSESGTGNLKDDQRGLYVYVPPEVGDQIDMEYNRLNYKCRKEFNIDIEKNRHYYPVLVTRGINIIEDMSAKEFIDAIDDINE